MKVTADRFILDDEQRAIDLASGERVCLVSSTAGGPSEQARWVERCSWFSLVTHRSIAPLLDYGALGETHRFEAWAGEPGWHGAPAAASQALVCATRFLEANGRGRITEGSRVLAARGARPAIVPDAAAGLVVSDPCASSPASIEASRDVLGILRSPDRRLTPVIELFGGQSSGRVVAAGVWTPDPVAATAAIRDVARAARLGGYVPVSTRLVGVAPLDRLCAERTLLIIARDDPDAGWRALVHLSTRIPKPHIVIFVGSQVIPRVHTVSLSRYSSASLVAAVSPKACGQRHLRAVSMAARRANGQLGRFEQLLFGNRFPSAPEVRVRRSSDISRPERVSLAVGTAHDRGRERVAEPAVSYDSARAAVVGAPQAPNQAWPAPGELAKLRRQLEAARALFARGRHHPGERLARQVMHACARRGEWTLACQSLLVLAEALLRRGQIGAADAVLAAGHEWAERSRDLGIHLELGLMRAHVSVESGRLVEAEGLLDALISSSLSCAEDLLVRATLVLARCLYWQGRYADAWQRLALVQHDAEAVPADVVRLCVLRSAIAIGRERVADAVADAARARDTAEALTDHSLCAEAQCACAFVQLSAGDPVQAEALATTGLALARRARDPLLAVSLRVLRAEIAWRRGHRGPAAAIVKRMARVSRAALPGTTRARIDLLSDLLAGADPCDAVEKRVVSSNLPALRLHAPARHADRAALASSAVEEVAELLHCCHAAEDERGVLAGVCARLRVRLKAAAVGFFLMDGNEPVLVSSDGARLEPATARRVLAANQLVQPHAGGDRLEAGVPVRYAGQVIGALTTVWTAAASWHPGDVALLLSTAATASGPALSALGARRSAGRSSPVSDLLGVSTAIADVRHAIDRAASAPFGVLVEGESGTGKELVARLLHRLGPRRDRPFCTVNCAALPEDLVESELFGHARGAFTGAVVERRGVFEEAHTGTLFLDEVGELSARAQAKLLRAIQEGEIRRVGENIQRRVDVRLVVATNRNLRVEADAGRFRLDLLYRLDVVRIALPPLRDRRDDIPILTEHFWRDASARVRSRATLSSAAVAALTRYDWPGNIRELQNVLASIAVRAPKRGVLPPSALPPQFSARELHAALNLDAARRQFDRSFIRAALVRAGGQRTRAAEELGLSRQGLAKLMTRLGIDDGDRSNECSPVPRRSGPGLPAEGEPRSIIAARVGA